MRDSPLVSLRPRTRASAVGRLEAYALRISLLEQCNLACGYCLPGEVNPYTENARWLRADEHARLAPLFSRRGVRKVRFTGGEPLLRKDMIEIVAVWAGALPGAEIAATTNGLLLGQKLDGLIGAGLSRLNVHIDSLRDDRYRALMGPGSVHDVLRACETAVARDLALKINVVVQKGLNDDELDDFLRLSAQTGIEVRFIELMDTGSATDRVAETFISGREILARIGERRAVVSLSRRALSDPAALYRCEDDGITFGLIASDTRPFCGHCDRLRLSADGRLRGCLYAPGGEALGDRLRAGASDDELLSIIDDGLDDKRSWHPQSAIERLPFSMADIGG